jgi:hypothetical protein
LPPVDSLSVEYFAKGTTLEGHRRKDLQELWSATDTVEESDLYEKWQQRLNDKYNVV